MPSPGEGRSGWRPTAVEREGATEAKEILDELKDVLVARLRFDPRRAAEMTSETPLPKGVEGSIGLDSLDFIELSIAIEERFGFELDEGQDVAEHFASLETLCRFIARRQGGE